jgi:hypothetical protein
VTDPNTRIIEINGVKFEVDMRTARRVDELRVGTKVKVLVTSIYGEPKVWPGVIIGFEPFEKLPTILVAYIETDYSKADMKFVHYNAKTKDVEIIAAADDMDLDRSKVLDWFDRELHRNEIARQELLARRDYFTDQFAIYWEKVVPAAEPELETKNEEVF